MVPGEETRAGADGEGAPPSAAPFESDGSRADRAASFVRSESSAGRLTPLGRAWGGTAEDLQAALDEIGAADVKVLRESGCVFLFSDRSMTAAYASLAARAEAGSVVSAIVETVRHDSRAYPRPTPVIVFSGPPFNLSPEGIAAALDAIGADTSSADIKQVRASDGSVFLFSSNEMDAGLAASRAEWMAVGRCDNP
ncbi:MAG: hypothetical protein ACE148_12270 [Vicinamibacterales bacterium]